MRVKITKSSGERYWYKHRIGETFTVFAKYSHGYLVKEFESSKVADSFIDFCDCEVVQEKTYTAALREKLKYYFGTFPVGVNDVEDDIENAIKAIVRLNRKYGK